MQLGLTSAECEVVVGRTFTANDRQAKEARLNIPHSPRPAHVYDVELHHFLQVLKHAGHHAAAKSWEKRVRWIVEIPHSFAIEVND